MRTLRKHLPADIPLIGCGGISSGADALEFARAGANAVQIYTAFGYDGVGACRRIKDEISDILRREGTTWSDVVTKAVAKLSAPTRTTKSEAVEPKQTGAGGEETTVKSLIADALSLRERLDMLETRIDE